MTRVSQLQKNVSLLCTNTDLLNEADLIAKP